MIATGKRRTSPWAGIGLVDDGVNNVQAAKKRLKFNPQPDDMNYIIEAGDTLTSIAYKFYGEPLLWWLIADRNKIVYWWKVDTGSTIVIPSARNIDVAIRNRGRAG